MNNIKSSGLLQLSQVSRLISLGSGNHALIGTPVSHLPAYSCREGWGARSPYRVEEGLNEVFILFEEKKWLPVSLLILGLRQ